MIKLHQLDVNSVRGAREALGDEIGVKEENRIECTQRRPRYQPS